MDVNEFSNSFDLYYNNVTSNQAAGLNEWEKSVILTKAQEEILKNHFNPKSNSKQEGFDDSPKRQADFSKLIKTTTLETVVSDDLMKFDQRSKAFAMPDDLFLVLNEQIFSGNTQYTIVPITYSDYSLQMSKPYKYPPKYQAWRLIGNQALLPSVGILTVRDSNGTYNAQFISNKRVPVKFTLSWESDGVDEVYTEETYIECDWNYSQELNSDDYYNSVLKEYMDAYDGVSLNDGFLKSSSGTFFAPSNAGSIEVIIPPSIYHTIYEVIGRFANEEAVTYKMRYLRKPNPIILVDLNTIQTGLTIQGESAPMTSELPEELHEEILQRAVEIAKAAWQGDLNATVQMGERSE